jgi:uncharacterized protein YndB with AHSA1/START domain
VLLRLEKLLLVPRKRVFAAFVDADQLRVWFGPRGFTVSDLELDPVVGNGYRLTIQPPEGDAFHVGGTFHAVEAPRRLAFTFLYEEPDPDDQETLVTVTLEATGQGTRLLLEQSPFKTAARRELHRDGWTESLERLEEALS